MLFESSLSSEQHEAVELCSDRSKRIVGVTGEAGSGKTSTLQFVHAALLPTDTVALVAPTGRAAKRIEEATGIPAKTIHRFLRWSMPVDDDDYGMPAYTKDNRYPFSVVLVDEASMVNDELYRALIDAMPNRGIIRFFGDANQLPPVEGISPFLRILDKFPSVKLTKNFRSDDGIVTAARQIIRGRVPEPNPKFTMYNPGDDKLTQTVYDYVDDTFRGTSSQMVIPTNVGKYGCNVMNRMLQQKLNPNGRFLEIKDRDDNVKKFRKNDKIIWTKNDYKLNLYNGTIGWVTDIDFETGDMILNIEGVDKLVPPHIESYNPDGRAIFQYDPRTQINLAYAITTHKAQGSEFDRVLLMLVKSYVLNRSNFYTAVTRARKHVTVLCGRGGLAKAMKI